MVVCGLSENLPRRDHDGIGRKDRACVAVRRRDGVGFGARDTQRIVAGLFVRQWRLVDVGGRHVE